VERRPAAVMLSFGDPRPLIEPIRRAGAALIVQVTDLDEARQPMDVGADVIIAQGTEAGGHGGRRSTLPFVPAVVDLAAPTPVLAADATARQEYRDAVTRGEPLETVWPSEAIDLFTTMSPAADLAAALAADAEQALARPQRS
jgi:NAD(P)H-dependent flavin oxidoreductase YrpB (nitropropane dioxygenase family)